MLVRSCKSFCLGIFFFHFVTSVPFLSHLGHTGCKEFCMGGSDDLKFLIVASLVIVPFFSLCLVKSVSLSISLGRNSRLLFFESDLERCLGKN